MNRPAARDLERVHRAGAVREDPALVPLSCSASAARSRRRTSTGARAALPELRSRGRARAADARARDARRTARCASSTRAPGPDAYWRRRTWKRIAVIAAGPAANIVVAFLIFFVVFATGAPVAAATTQVGAGRGEHAGRRRGPAARATASSP